VQRPRRLDSAARESAAIWRALHDADARVYVVRTATPALGIVGLFCLLRRRKLIFSSANDGDFTYETIAPGSRGLFRLGVGLSHAVVVQSHQQREIARRAFPRAARVVEIPSFVEPAPAELQALARTDGGGRFLWVGRLVDYKQPLKFVELAEAVPEASFLMIGYGTSLDQRLPDEVRRRAAAVANLQMLEPRPHAEVLRLLAQSTALISTSRLEGMPNVFLEAWSLGVPVVSLAFDPDGRIRRHGLGVIAEDAWPRFVEAVRSLAREPARRLAMGEAIAAYLADTHSLERVTGAWRELMEELL
jgi:glycosyltransferase involved in cell wall biosynthesis